ncbi:MAG: sugar ABC transporter permease [Abditibacteriota bacterium]|nr:sugar ABC transporter permease [Abditibacteriota bacterium]
MHKLRFKRNLAGYLFIAPWLIGFLVFTVGPFISSIYLSFTRYDVLSSPVWIGLVNYQELFTNDPVFWKSLWITIKYALIAVPLGIVFGVFLAIILNNNIKGIEVFRTLFYIPSIVPVVATSVVFMWLLNPNIGLINTFLARFGIEGANWLGDSRYAFGSLIFMGMWGVGGSMIIYLAGLKDVPGELYEASVIDGANWWQRIRHITLPLISPVIFFNLIMGVIGSFQYFTQAFIMTKGGPEDSTMFYSLYLFNRAWRYLDMGYASAMAWILFIIIVAITALLFKFQKSWVHYGGQ